MNPPGTGTVQQSVAVGVPAALLAGLLDDAATFPPANALVRDSVEARAMYEDSWFAELLGAFVLRADRTPELVDALAVTGARARASSQPLPVTVTVPGGLDQIGGAVAATRHPALQVVSFEVPLGPVQPDTQLLVGTRMEVPSGSELYIELSAAADPALTMPVLAEAGVRAKLRAGGVTAAAFPSEDAVARFVHAAVTARVPFKATAGLHNALRHRDEDTGFEHHGFLNLLAATAVALLHGADLTAVAGLVAARGPDPVLEVLTVLDEVQARAVRQAFVGLGTCSTVEPVEDLAALGLIARPAGGAGA